MKTYVIIYLVDEGFDIIRNCNNFAEAIIKLSEYEGINSDLFKKSIRGFEIDDINGLIELYNHFSDKTIKFAYEVSKELYNDGDKKECLIDNTGVKIINTFIDDSNCRKRNLLDFVSIQLSDGYWENEDIFNEYWNWLNFRDIDGKLHIIINKEPCWNAVKDIFSNKRNYEVIAYVANALEYCYDTAPHVLESEYTDDEIENTIEALKKCAR